MKDIIDSIQTMAVEYRERHKIDQAQPIEMYVHRDVAEKLIAFYGSLEEAAQHIFDECVVIIDRTARDITDKVNMVFASGPAPFRLSNYDTITNIALAYVLSGRRIKP